MPPRIARGRFEGERSSDGYIAPTLPLNRARAALNRGQDEVLARAARAQARGKVQVDGDGAEGAALAPLPERRPE